MDKSEIKIAIYDFLLQRRDIYDKTIYNYYWAEQWEITHFLSVSGIKVIKDELNQILKELRKESKIELRFKRKRKGGNFLYRAFNTPVEIAKSRIKISIDNKEKV